MKLIDLSEHNGAPDFEALRGHVGGVILRAGYGRGNADRQFARSAAECARLGIPFGAYWFSYAWTPELARAEAEALLAAAEPWPMTLPLAFDWEYASRDWAVKQGAAVTPELVRAIADAFCRRIEAAGRWCLLYANPDFIARYFGDLAGGRYDLWLAQWPKRVDVTKPPRPCGVWQWGGSTVPGVQGTVDTNEAYKDYPALLASGPAPGPAGNADPGVPPAAAPDDDSAAWAMERGIWDGTRPDDFATRAEVVRMLYNLTRKEDCT